MIRINKEEVKDKFDTFLDKASELKIEKPRDLPEGSTSLIKWHLIEEKKEYSKDKGLLVAIIGTSIVIISIILNSYVFAFLVILATLFFIYTGRQKPQRILFNITDYGIFLERGFLSLEDIEGFNIVDDPGERARLILEVSKVIKVNEIVPIYDVDMIKIEEVLESLGIEKDESLRPGLLDNLSLIV